MDKQERTLIWKYFWQQKLIEVVRVLLIVLAIIFIPFTIGHYIGDNIDIMCDYNLYSAADCNNFMQWVEGLFWIFVTLIGLYIFSKILIGIFKTLSSWVESNWTRARKRAKAEVQKIKNDAKRGLHDE